MNLAIVTDWLTNYGGAECVISAMHEMYPDAPLYTTLFNPKKMKELSKAHVISSFLQKIPFAKRDHKLFLAYMPQAIECFDLSKYDIVLSSCHSISKGVITKPETFHICYCHTPMRYAWDTWQEYIKQWKLPKLAERYVYKKMHKIRMWDRLAAERVDYYIANSAYVARRIQKYYRKKAEVLQPPVDTKRFIPTENPSLDYFLAAGRLIPYKRFDLIVEVFNTLGLPLKIAGKGPELKKLQKLAKKNVQILGFVSDEELVKLYQNCKAFIFPQIEDAGIVPVEAMASGRPVIALNKGGASETVIAGKTGEFFEEQTPGSLMKAVQSFSARKFDSVEIRKHAEKYGREEFMKRLKEIIERESEKYWKRMKEI